MHSVLLILIGATAFAANESKNIEEVTAAGKTRFDRACASCHNVGKGPSAPTDLKGVTTNRDLEWLKAWYQDTTAGLVPHIEKARKQQPQSGKSRPNAPSLNAEAIEEIFVYLQSESR